MQTSSYRTQLKLLTQAFGLIILFVFLYVIFKGSFWSPSSHSIVERNSDFKAAVPLGSTKLIRQGNQRFWVSHLNTQQKQWLTTLNSWVIDNEKCSIQSDFCLINSTTARSGVILRFTEKKPAQLNANTPWRSGFVNPATKSVYDLLGRQYK